MLNSFEEQMIPSKNVEPLYFKMICLTHILVGLRKYGYFVIYNLTQHSFCYTRKREVKN